MTAPTPAQRRALEYMAKRDRRIRTTRFAHRLGEPASPEFRPGMRSLPLQTFRVLRRRGWIVLVGEEEHEIDLGSETMTEIAEIWELSDRGRGAIA